MNRTLATPSKMIPAIANEIVQANTLHLVHQMEAFKKLYPDMRFDSIDLPHSLTIQSLVEYGVKLNHTVEFGMRGPVTKTDVVDIERLYATGLDPCLMICEFADLTAVKVLTDAGYTCTSTICSFFKDLSHDLTTLPSSDINISIFRDRAAFAQSSVEGFQSGGRAPELLKLLAESAITRADTTIFAAEIEGKLIGCGGMAIIQTKTAKVANFYIDSTLPTHRGMGVHKALILARILAAKQAGCDLAIASAQTDSGSARNFTKYGFARCFTSEVYTRLSEKSSEAS